ncbi:MAG: ABC transporter permease [Planctomycetaceae bacterium]|nr:ABC transporter permease [Planctomycetaceae bacterium]
MLSYLVRRFGQAVLTLLLVTFLVYGLIRNIPGSPLTVQAASLDPSKDLSEADRQMLLKTYGLDRPWYESYVVWVGNALRGDLGRSFGDTSRPVATIVYERMGPTLLLSISSLLLTYLFSIPFGLYATANSGRMDERFFSTLLYVLYSFPSFVAALFLQLWLAVRWGWLPLLGMKSDNFDSLSTAEQAWDILQHALLPMICYTYGSLAYYSRFIKANMNEVIRQDYIRTARAKGLGPFQVFFVHGFRNTLIPFVTQIGLLLPSLLSGAIIIERIFNWPGMGNLFFESINRRDYPTIMALVLMFSILTLLGQLLADILYAVADPRIRLEDQG